MITFSSIHWGIYHPSLFHNLCFIKPQVILYYQIKDDDVLTVGIQNFHFANLEEFFNVSYAEAELIRKPRVISTSCLDLIDEYLSNHGHLKHEVEGRIVIAE